MNKFKILVVDDIDVNRRLLQAFATKGGYEADTAESGQQAIEMVSQTSYDLILMDIQMPEMDGVEAATRINDMRPGQTMVALTASEGAEELAGFNQSGLSGFLRKPVNFTDLEYLISRLQAQAAAS